MVLFPWPWRMISVWPRVGGPTAISCVAEAGSPPIKQLTRAWCMNSPRRNRFPLSVLGRHAVGLFEPRVDGRVFAVHDGAAKKLPKAAVRDAPHHFLEPAAGSPRHEC